MKGCLFILVSRQLQLDIFDAAILSTVVDYKKVLIADHGISESIADADSTCYDEIHFVNTKKEGKFALYYDPKELEMVMKTSCREFSPEDVYVFSADEYNLEIIADVTTNLGAHGLRSDMAPLFRDKDLMKQYLTEHSNVKLPKHLMLNASHNYQTLAEQLGSPFIVKPTAEAAALGVSLISNPEEWSALENEHNNDFSGYEAENFLKGNLFHADSVRIDGKIIAITIAEYLFPVAEHLNEKPIGSILITEGHPTFDAISQLNQQVLDAFNVDGCFHLECFAAEGEAPVFLEVAWRQGGIPVDINFTQYYGGCSQTLLYLLASLGYPFPEPNLLNFQKVGVMFPKRKAVFNGLNLSKLKAVDDVTLLVEEGEQMQKPTFVFDLAAKINLKSVDYSTLYKDFLTLRESSLYC